MSLYDSSGFRIIADSIHSFECGIWGLDINKNDEVFFGCDSIIYKVKNNTIQVLKKGKEIPNEDVYFIEVDSNNKIWLGYYNKVIYCEEINNNLIVLQTIEFSDENIYKIYEDKQNNILVGTSKNLYKVHKKQNFTLSKPLLTNNIVYSIYQDKFDTYWVGTEIGVYKIHYNNVKGIFEIDGFTNEPCVAIVQDDEDNYWFGTDNALFKLPPYECVLYERFEDQQVYPWYIFEDSKKNKFIAAHRNGIVKIEDGKIVKINNQGELAQESARWMYEDSKGIIWIAADNGLFRMQNERIS